VSGKPKPPRTAEGAEASLGVMIATARELCEVLAQRVAEAAQADERLRMAGAILSTSAVEVSRAAIEAVLGPELARLNEELQAAQDSIDGTSDTLSALIQGRLDRLAANIGDAINEAVTVAVKREIEALMADMGAADFTPYAREAQRGLPRVH
jgi:hypothetical protein